MTAEAFLACHNQSPFQLDAPGCLQALSGSTLQGLRGAGGLPMVPSFLSGDIRIPESGSCYVMDAGGTNLRTGLARFEGGQCHLEQMKTIPMPGSDGTPLSAGELYGRIAAELKRLEPQARLGCCFSYLVDMEPSLDGRLREWCKEIRCPEAVGQYVGASLSRCLPGQPQVVVLNDSTAALLGARVLLPRGEDPFLGLIMGTGVNICYCESRENIPKLDAAPGGHMILSTEAGEFRGIPLGTFDREVIRSTDDPGSAQAEKQCSGAYLGQIIAAAMNQAFREGLISRPAEAFDLAAVSDFLADPERGFAGLPDRDLPFARELCSLCVHRSAKIGAILTAEFALRSAPRGGNVRICAEGSLFWKMHGFRELFRRELEALVQPRGVRFTIEAAPNACLAGTAAAAFALP